MFPYSIQKLIDRFAKFPTVGPRTAARFVFYLFKLSQEDIDAFVIEIQALKQNIKSCEFCFNTFDITRQETDSTLCAVCRNSTRQHVLCVVEKESDIETLEKTKVYQGYYFVLGGTVSGMRKDDINSIRTKELKERIQKPENFRLPFSSFEELIIATNPTTEGDATALYLERALQSFDIPISKLGRGLPIGGELEYADEETIKSSFERRM